MDEQQRYLFDLQGYLVLKNILPLSEVSELKEACVNLENTTSEKLPYPVCHGKKPNSDELYLSNVVEAAPIFENLIDVPEVIDIVRETSPGTFRLNHTNLISRSGHSYTRMHMGNVPTHPKAIYRCQSGEIFSSLTKAVFPIDATSEEDGCFAVIPGSHKANFRRPWSDHPNENPPLVPIITKPGDAIVFSEALAHGSLVKQSKRIRRTLYYCYSVGYMPDWGKLGLHFSENFAARLTDKQQEIIRVK